MFVVAASSRTSELKLPTVAVAVRLAVVGGTPIDVELFVADLPRQGRGALLDDLAALVASADEFLPVRSDHRVQLFGKHAVAWISVTRWDPAERPPRELASDSPDGLTLYDHQHKVRVELVSGAALTGTLLDSDSADRSRAIDHLNRAGRWLRLWTTDLHYLVNTRQIVSVTELGELGELGEPGDLGEDD